MQRQDVQDATGRSEYNPGYGQMRAWGKVAPTNGVQGFAPGAFYQNLTGGPGTAFYVNIGTFLSSQWINVDSPDGGVVLLTAAITLSPSLHAGRTLMWNLAGGFTATLPAATGSGAIYRFQVLVVSTTGYVLSAAGTDKIKGGLLITAAGATAGTGCWFVSTTNANITLNGTTTGGVAIGDYYQVQDIASGLWLTSGGLLTGSGTLATPFS
jgi:hypothetical protein